MAQSRVGAKARSVFINCPFDDAYRPLLRATCFTLLACGYRPRCALDESDSGRVRFEAILDMITACGLSIHDISRVEVDAGLPRFNMPLELGADLGLRMRGPAGHRTRRTLVMDAEPHRYDRTLSDISGMDIAVHHNRPETVIGAVRDWLNARPTPPSEAPLPGTRALVTDYGLAQELAPDIIGTLRLDSLDELAHVDFLHVVERALRRMEARRG